MDNKESIPEWKLDKTEVRVAAVRAGLEMKDLAAAIGITKQGLSYMLTNGTYTRKTLSALCHHLGVTPMGVLKRFDPPNHKSAWEGNKGD